MITIKERLKRDLLIAAFLGHAGATLLLLYLPVTLLIHAETAGGRLVAGSFCLLLGSLVFCWSFLLTSRYEW